MPTVIDPKKLQRARDEHIKLKIIGPNAFVVKGDSGQSHVIDTKGVEALYCTCPDYEHNCGKGEKCKHMIAYEEWEVDEVIV